MNVSLIITTYNRPDALKLVLKSAFNQKQLPDEIIVADDGSTQETYRCIKEVSSTSPIPIVHIWQEDKGFRAAMVRNRAIAASRGDYIIMIDGDMILHPCFIYDHLAVAKSGFFVQGSRVLLGKALSCEILKSGRTRFSILESDIKNRKNLLHSRLIGKLFCATKNSLKGIRTCNFALFKKNILAVNGFDNRFVGWGREDSEFAVRLMNSGVMRKNLKFMAIAYHLFHNENFKSSLQENDLRLQRSIEKKLIRCENGIDRFLKSPMSL